MMPSPSAEQLSYLGPLLDHTEDAVVACDADWRVTVWNEGARRLLGWTAEEAVGQPGTFFDSDESGPQRLDGRRQLARYGRWRGNVTVQRKDGSEVPVESVIVAVRDEEGETSGYLGIHRDITERNRAGVQLAYLASLLDNLEDAVIATDADDFRITAWNKGAERLYGFTAEEVLGRPGRQVASYPGDEARHKLEHELLETGRTRIEFTAHRKDDTPIDVELIAAKVTDDRGDVAGYLGIHRDVTQRRRREKELHQAHRRTETVLESISDFFSAFDRQWRYTYLNRRGLDRFRQALGEEVSLGDVVGKNVWELFPGIVGTTIDHELHRAMREQVTVVHDAYSPVTESWVQMHAHPTADGGLSVYGHDITERKQAEQLVGEAREAEQSRIARDLHDGPLQGLSAAIALVAMADKTTAESPLAGQLLPVLRGVGEQLRFAMYDLRPESEEHTPFVKRLERLVDGHRAMMSGCEIQLEISDDAAYGSLGGDGIEVVRVLGEALTNACRHADARRVLVRVSDGQDGLWAEVSDDGRGFDTALAGSPIHRGISGMRERAELLKGRLEIHSEPGVGTTVRLEAPLGNGTTGNTGRS